MKVAHAALWAVESHLQQTDGCGPTLADIARRLGVTSFHLARAFNTTFDMSLMQYVRRRRLAQAAKLLRTSDARLLDVAMQSGYSSQEAFTRAFVAEFKQPPYNYRQHRESSSPAPLEAITMQPENTISLAHPHVKHIESFHLIGLTRHYQASEGAHIPDQWGQFNQSFALTAASPAFGVCYNTTEAGAMDYMCGAAPEHIDQAPGDAFTLKLPAQTYAVFSHDGHVAEIRHVWAAIWNEGLASAGLTAAQGPQLEHYRPEFDPDTGAGGYEIWIPVEEA
ncbi:MAG: AraC family transcriptional regulator [Pseudomonadota bacterium]